ncbi:MAG: carbohydrate ABC transporter permease [Treponema sp.]|nr:carbohydrate ABC transporter permease [Treponema sp.]
MNNSKFSYRGFDAVFSFIVYLLAIVLLIIFAYPLYFILIASFSDANAVWGGHVWVIPVSPTLDGYREIIKNKDIWSGYYNSLIITALGTCINLFVTLTVAYSLSRKDFKARGIMLVFIMFTMFFSGGMIPTYLLIRNLHMLDTVWALILPVSASVTEIIIARTFFANSIPHELQDAGFLDGCSNIRYLIKIVLPLSKPIIAVLALYYGVARWGTFFSAFIYISTRAKMPLQVILRDIVASANATEGMTTGDEFLRQYQLVELMKYGTIVVASLPALIAYPFIQKYFVKGVMIGSVKG